MALTIAVTNQSSLADDQEICAALAAIEKQVERDFAPVWFRTAKLWFNQSARMPANLGAWNVVIVDQSDVPDALGYHELLGGKPYALVSVKPDLEAGGTWTGTLSHEILEMLADPFVCETVIRRRKAFDLEVCDPVEDDSYGYRIDDVLVSNFVYPAWFGMTDGQQYDHANKCHKQFHVLKGGFIGTEHLAVSKYRVLLHDNKPLEQKRIPIGSRRWRRGRFGRGGA